MNVRIDASLKDAGDEVLDAIGWSLTQTVRNVWSFLSAHRDDPQAVVRILCDEPADDVERAKQKERAHKMSLAEEGRGLFSDGCSSLGLDLASFSRDESDEDLLAEALLDRLAERGLA